MIAWWTSQMSWYWWLSIAPLCTLQWWISLKVDDKLLGRSFMTAWWTSQMSWYWWFHTQWGWISLHFILENYQIHHWLWKVKFWENAPIQQWQYSKSQGWWQFIDGPSVDWYKFFGFISHYWIFTFQNLYLCSKKNH